MANEKREWTYFDDEKQQWHQERFTITELDDLYARNVILDHTMCVTERMASRGGVLGPIRGVPYSNIERTRVTFEPTPQTFLENRSGNFVTVLSGPNNGGKSLLLKNLLSLIGPDGYFAGCNRYSHVDVLNSRKREPHEHRRYWDSFMNEFTQSKQNNESSELRLDTMLTGMKDRQRKMLFDTAEELIGNRFVLQRLDSENEFSPFQVLMDGQNLRYGSSGTRLFLTLLGLMLDERFSALLIDEPELGLSPSLQSKLAVLILKVESRKRFAPHLERVFVATHSHIFLDRANYSNNFVVRKDDNLVVVSQIANASAFHELQFNMLGNELETIYLPSAIVIVEGDTDALFIGKLIEKRLGHRRVAIVRASGEGNVLEKIRFFEESFGEIASSPYAKRLFVLYDRRISTNIDRLVRKGISRENVIVLSMNGIENYYPRHILAEAFHCSTGEVALIQLESDPIEHNQHRVSKKELAKFVVARANREFEVHAELDSFLDKLKAAVS